MQGARTSKPPLERKLFDSENEKEEERGHSDLWKEDDRMTNDFDSDEVSSINMNCNVVSVLPHEFNQETEVEDYEVADVEEMAKHRPICYYIRAKIENVGI